MTQESLGQFSMCVKVRFMSENNRNALDFFIAGVPPFALFKLELGELGEVMASRRPRMEDDVIEPKMSNQTAEICLIGLVSYFEAFCKNLFAAVINICPQTLLSFTARRESVTIKVRNLIEISGSIDYRLGCILSEEYDFGSARTINSLFYDLLSISPLSKQEIGKYNRLLNDRNLLVHHGGVFTIKYSGQRLGIDLKDRVYWDSIVVEKSDFDLWSDFLLGIAEKMSIGSYKALNTFLGSDDIVLSDLHKRAVEYLVWETAEDESRMSAGSCTA